MMNATPFDTAAVTAFQMVAQIRMQTDVVHGSSLHCMRKCMDLALLVTPKKRGSLKELHRLKTEDQEKQCVQFCGAKYDELYGVVTKKINQRETGRAQWEFMMAQHANMARGMAQ
jgi:hypothetical protein